VVVQKSPTPPLASGGAIPFNNMHYVYLLKSEKDNKFYIGYSSDLKLRFKQHIDGKVKSTKNRRPLKLVYYEAYDSERLAGTRETQLKKFGSAYMALLKRLDLKKLPD